MAPRIASRSAMHGTAARWWSCRSAPSERWPRFVR
jgi:hypothetical protein